MCSTSRLCRPQGWLKSAGRALWTPAVSDRSGRQPQLFPWATVPVPDGPLGRGAPEFFLAAFGAAFYGAPDTLATSTFSPGPMVEDNDTRLM